MVQGFDRGSLVQGTVKLDVQWQGQRWALLSLV